MTGKRGMADCRGTVTAEALLIMPFIVVMLLLLVNAGAAGVVRQRSLGAVRTSAFYDVFLAAREGEERYSTSRRELLERDVLGPALGGVDAKVVIGAGSGGNELGPVLGEEEGLVDEATGLVRSALDTLGRPRRYRLDIDMRFPAERLAPDGTLHSSLYIDNAFWTYPEDGNVYLSAVTAQLSWGRFIGILFPDSSDVKPRKERR